VSRYRGLSPAEFANPADTLHPRIEAAVTVGQVMVVGLQWRCEGDDAGHDSQRR
jgi:hypothetical protein